MSSVGSMEPEGIWYGLTIQCWIPSARPSASATITTSSRSAPWVLWGLGGLSLSLLLPVRERLPRPAASAAPARPQPPPAPQPEQPPAAPPLPPRTVL